MDYVKEEDGWIFAECPECHMIMKFRKNELQRLSIRYKLYESVECFCGRDDEWIYGVPMEQTATNTTPAHSTPTYSTPARNVPHCPTCGSENVTKISLGSKAVGGAMFGIFSSNIRKSYKCNNCGYKW